MKIKVRLNTARVPTKGDPQTVGQAISVDGDEAVRLVESGQAEPLDSGKYASIKESYDKEQEQKRKLEADADAEAEAIALRRQAEELMQKADELLPESEDQGGK